MLKKCCRCKIEKYSLEFSKRHASYDGLRSSCRVCTNLYCQTQHGVDIRKHGAEKYRNSHNGKLVRKQCMMRRRELSRGLDLLMTPENVTTLHERFKHQCFNCGCGEHLQIDHHYPLSRGHGLRLDNAVLLYRSCNASKSDKLPHEFYTHDQLAQLECILTNF